MIYQIQNIIHPYLNNHTDHFTLHSFYISPHKIKLYVERIDTQQGWGNPLQVILFSMKDKDYEILNVGTSHIFHKIIILDVLKIELLPKNIFWSPKMILYYHSNAIPRFIHRTLLYDETFPNKALEYIESFIIKHPNFQHILWRNEDILQLLSKDKPDLLPLYDTLSNIQKSDFARLLILQKYGGMYVDFDIRVFKCLDLFFDLYKYEDSILFVEHVHLDQNLRLQPIMKIRNGNLEDSIRIANYLMISKPQSEYINKCIELLLSRLHLPVFNNYDILYITGPDITSTIHAQNQTLSIVINKSMSDSYLSHECFGHWKS